MRIRMILSIKLMHFENFLVKWKQASLYLYWIMLYSKGNIFHSILHDNKKYVAQYKADVFLNFYVNWRQFDLYISWLYENKKYLSWL